MFTKHPNAHTTAMFGIFSCVLVFMGAFASAWFYSGRTHEQYSIFNHFISELGNTNYSGHAYFFNDAMIVAGLTIMVFMVGVTKLLVSKSRYALLASGLVAGLLCSLVGYYSSDQFDIHFVVAGGFFNCTLLSSLIFCFTVVREKGKGYFPPMLAMVGILPVVTLGVFILLQASHTNDFRNGHVHGLFYARPAFWALPFAEWLVAISLMAWILIISGYLYYRQLKEVA